MREIALEARRTRDRLEVLDEAVPREPLLCCDAGGRVLVHPAAVEARKQAATLKQLIAALGLSDPKTGRRPQRRGPHGVSDSERV